MHACMHARTRAHARKECRAQADKGCQAIIWWADTEKNMYWSIHYTRSMATHHTPSRPSACRHARTRSCMHARVRTYDPHATSPTIYGRHTAQHLDQWVRTCMCLYNCTCMRMYPFSVGVAYIPRTHIRIQKSVYIHRVCTCIHNMPHIHAHLNRQHFLQTCKQASAKKPLLTGAQLEMYACRAVLWQPYLLCLACLLMIRVSFAHAGLVTCLLAAGAVCLAGLLLPLPFSFWLPRFTLFTSVALLVGSAARALLLHSFLSVVWFCFLCFIACPLVPFLSLFCRVPGEQVCYKILRKCHYTYSHVIQARPQEYIVQYLMTHR